jgi:hypothetical protein
MLALEWTLVAAQLISIGGAFLVLTFLFVAYVLAVLWGFSLLMGYSFARANHYVWRWAKRKLKKLDERYLYRFQARGFRHAAYYRARELAFLLWGMCALILIHKPELLSFDMAMLLGVTLLIIMANTLQGWFEGQSKGTVRSFVRIYFEPAILLVSPFFGVGKVIEFMASASRETKLISLSSFLTF